jgi:hypothetical protein
VGDGSKWAKRFKNDIKNRELEVLGLRKSSRNPQEKQQKSSGKGVAPGRGAAKNRVEKLQKLR